MNIKIKKILSDQQVIIMKFCYGRASYNFILICFIHFRKKKIIKSALCHTITQYLYQTHFLNGKMLSHCDLGDKL